MKHSIEYLQRIASEGREKLSKNVKWAISVLIQKQRKGTPNNDEKLT